MRGTKPGAHFTNDFSIVIKIVTIDFLAITSLQCFAHATTAQLVCQVKILWQSLFLNLGESKIKFSSNLNSVRNIFSETGPRPLLVQIMAFRLIDAEPLPEPMLEMLLGSNISEILIESNIYFNRENVFQQAVCKVATILSRPQIC